MIIKINQLINSSDVGTIFPPTDESLSIPISTTHSFFRQQIVQKSYDMYDLPITTSMAHLVDSENQGESSNYEKQSMFRKDSTRNSYKKKRYLQFDLENQEPSNHQRQFIDVTEPPRPFGHVLKGNQPASFQPRANSTISNLPKDYSGQVDSIQDIISQISHLIQVSRLESLPAFVARTGRKVRFGGRYRQRKTDEMPPPLINPENVYRIQPSKQTLNQFTSPPIIGNDKFYPYKPQSMADINLMAMNEFRFAPKSPLIDSEQYYRKETNKQTHLVSDIYQQIIRSNNMRDEADRFVSRNGQSKMQKPFSLMLDVYPIHDEESPNFPPTTTRRPDHRPILRKPMAFDNVSAQHVQNTLNSYPLHYEQQYFRNMKFPQINPYINQVKNYHQENDNLYNSQFSNYNYNRLGAASRFPKSPVSENRPSQITVHLNLFPKSKHSPVHQRRHGIKPGENNIIFAATRNPSNRKSRISRAKEPNSDHSIETSFYDNLGNPSAVVFASSVLPPTSSEEPLATQPTIHNLTQIISTLPSHQPLYFETVYPLNFNKEPTTANPQQYTEITSSEDILSPKNIIKFEDHIRFDISTVIPINPRNMPETPFS